MCTNVSRALLVLVFMAASALSQEMVDAQVPVKVNVAANVKIEPPASIGGEGAEGGVNANTSKNFNIKLVAKPGPLQCVLANENTIGTVGTAVSRDVFNITCNGATVTVTSASNTWSNLTPASNGPFAITITRAATASSCAGETATCTIGVGEKLTSVRFVSPLFSQNSEVVLYSIKGNKVQNNTNLPAGIYLVKSNFLTTKVAHRGGVLKVNAPLLGNSASMPSQALAKPGDYGEWSIVVSAEGYSTQRRSFSPDAGENSEESFTLKQFEAPVKQSFTETVNGQSFDMVYIPGGTFTIGCESGTCPSDTKPVSGVQVSNYFIGKTEVTTALYNAVMGITCASTDYMCRASGSATNITWYEAMEFACRLSELTGKNYRMTTEAEWEYAAKNHVSSLDRIGSGEEWAYNSWQSAHSGGTDPVGTGSGKHTQKTRRDAQGSADNITGRLIRSIEGEGPALRLALSADVELPPGYVSPCNLHAPVLGPEPENSYRDPRWVTGSNQKWAKDAETTAIGDFDLRVWEDGTATIFGRDQYYREVNIEGQWFTSNNFTFVFVPTSGSIKRYAYVFLNDFLGSLISDQGWTNGYIGRIEKVEATPANKPTIANLMSGEALAKAQTDFNTYYKMVDMNNPPTNQQDSRLIDTKDQGWFQDNTAAGGLHHYRKDVDAEEFRFTVNQGGGRTMLANGTWFTVNNTFLRVTHSTGYKVDYLYAYVPASGSGQTAQGETFYHNSFMAYERGDFRMFQKKTNGGEWPCGSICSGEIPTGQGVSMYDRMENGYSTFTPAPCPAGGCK